MTQGSLKKMFKLLIVKVHFLIGNVIVYFFSSHKKIRAFIVSEVHPKLRILENDFFVIFEFNWLKFSKFLEFVVEMNKKTFL